MPFHWNESRGQAALNFKNNGSFVTENHDFVFKGRANASPQALSINEHRKVLIVYNSFQSHFHLPNRFNMFTLQNSAIYILDDFDIHLMS